MRIERAYYLFKPGNHILLFKMEREDGEMSDDNMLVEDDVEMTPKTSTVEDKVTVVSFPLISAI